MEATANKTIDTLNHLIRMVNDGKLGYENAAENCTDTAMKGFFMKYSAQRGEFAHALISEVSSLGGEPATGSGPLGALHRAWIDVKDSVGANDKASIVASCITGEDAAIKAYTEALATEGLSYKTRELIKEQLMKIQETQNALRSQTA